MARDSSTGQIITATGLNGEQTSYAYNDPLDRITAIQAPNGGETQYTYLNFTTLIAQKDQNTAGDGRLKFETTYDGLGRMSQMDLYETSSQFIAATQSYDAMGRVSTVTNRRGQATD